MTCLSVTSKSATGFEPLMAAALAPAMMTGAMMMQGYAFWMSAARGFMPGMGEMALNHVAAPVAAMHVGNADGCMKCMMQHARIVHRRASTGYRIVCTCHSRH